jgi:hypothetical protein
MNTNGKPKFKKILWAGKNTDDGSIAFNWMYNRRWEAVDRFKEYDDYKIVKVELREI